MGRCFIFHGSKRVTGVGDEHETFPALQHLTFHPGLRCYLLIVGSTVQAGRGRYWDPFHVARDHLFPDLSLLGLVGFGRARASLRFGGAVLRGLRLVAAERVAEAGAIRGAARGAAGSVYHL